MLVLSCYANAGNKNLIKLPGKSQLEQIYFVCVSVCAGALYGVSRVHEYVCRFVYYAL